MFSRSRAMGSKTVIKYDNVKTKTKNVSKIAGAGGLQASVKTRYNNLKKNWDSCEGDCASRMKMLLVKEEADAIEAAKFLDKMQKMIWEAANIFDQRDKKDAKESVKE